jgi:hypothetical protein
MSDDQHSPNLQKLIQENAHLTKEVADGFKRSGLLNFETIHEPRYQWLKIFPLKLLRFLRLTDEVRVYHDPRHNPFSN